MATPAQVKKIHALKGALGMDDATYRAMLAGYGLKSSKDRGCTIGVADNIIADLERKAVAAGAWEKRKPASASKTTRRLADDPQSKMLRAIWIELHAAGIVRNPAEAALCQFGKRLTRKDALQWYTDRDVTVVKKALNEMLERGRQ